MNKLQNLLLLGVLFLAGLGRAGVVAENLRCEYLHDPLGLDAAKPRLSWVISSSRRGEKQTACQILVASSEKLLAADTGDLWDSGKISSDASSQVAYAGAVLGSRQSCFWKVRVWDRDGQPAAWSSVARWQMGLLQPADWTAEWIEAPTSDNPVPLHILHATYEAIRGPGAKDVSSILSQRMKSNRLSLVVNNQTMAGDPATNSPKRLKVEYELGGKTGAKEIREGHTLDLPESDETLPCFRKSFDLAKPVQRAVLHVTALGLYELSLNGRRVGDHVLAPDWTDYRKRARYQTYDVTALLKTGPNAVGALLANGWYSGHIGNGGNQFFGKAPALLAQIEVTYADGSSEKIVTDASWKSHPSPIVSSDFMLGENYDARRGLPGWDAPGLDETGWKPAAVRAAPAIELQSQIMEPVREICELHAKSLSEPVPGHWVYDLGQNMVGVVRLKVTLPAGTKITLRHAEMLNPDGTIYTTNLRSAASVDTFICQGGGTEILQPHFTFHGFRYVEITGLKQPLSEADVMGVVIASDTVRTGEFACSDARLNQLQSNIQWGQRGNYLSIPTDCPQRDERLGWMGDAQVFIRTATYNADVAAFFSKWLVDVDDGQSPAGSFSDVNPNTMGVNGVPAWGDAGVICPWTIYETYGDKRILEKHLPAMIKWVEYLRAHSSQFIREKDRGNDYGDWLSIGADTPKDLIGTAYFAYSTHLVAKSLRVVGRDVEADKYDQLFADIKAAFNQRYVAADGRVKGNTQCAYAMALKFELLPAELRSKAAQYLEADIKAKGNHLSTGFVGVSYLLPVLTQADKANTAYDLLLQDSFPSWLFSVKHGATTIWERWDGWTPEKGFQDPGMNSFNHYSLGSCGEYLFGYIGGIRPASPGFKTITIDPVIRGGLTWAKTRYDSIAGRIATSWKQDGQHLSLEVEVPANTTATVCVPTRDPATVKESGKAVESGGEIEFIRLESGRAIYEVGSGIYQFTAEL